MICPRCNHPECNYLGDEMLGDIPSSWVEVWKCPKCGEVFHYTDDQIIDDFFDENADIIIVESSETDA